MEFINLNENLFEVMMPLNEIMNLALDVNNIENIPLVECHRLRYALDLPLHIISILIMLTLQLK